MTTIACDGNSIACDMQFTHARGAKLKGSTKILHIGEDVCKPMFNCQEAYIGFAGNADIWGEIVSWFCEPDQKQPKCKGIEFLMLTNKKQMFHGTNLRNWMLLKNKNFSIGSGMHFAIGAMENGASPLEAVKIASKNDPSTGMGFKSYSFD